MVFIVQVVVAIVLVEQADIGSMSTNMLRTLEVVIFPVLLVVRHGWLGMVLNAFLWSCLGMYILIRMWAHSNCRSYADR